MNEYEITIGVFIDANTYGDCEHFTIEAPTLRGAYEELYKRPFRILSVDKPPQQRRIISIKQIA